MITTERLEKVPISKLMPYANNARTHSKEQIKQLRASFREFGFVNPVIVDRDFGIIAGHGRVLAAKEEGLSEVPCIFADHLTEAQKKAYILADNQLALNAGWDNELLALEFSDLKDLGFDLELTGFDTNDIEKMLASNNESEAQEDDDFEVDSELAKPTISQLGDLWFLGRHRLLCGDALIPSNADTLMDGKKARLIITDLPYNVAYNAKGNKNHPSWKKRETIMNDDMPQEKFHEFLNKAFANMRRIAENGCMIYAFMSAQEWGAHMQALQDCGFHWSSTIIWNKDSLVLSRKDFHTKYEPIWYGWADGAPRLCPLNDRKQSDVWDVPRPKRSESHPTMKPIPLLSIAMKNSSKESDTVIDFFGGSGSTLITAEQLGRTCCSMELSPKYVDVIVNRYISLIDTRDGVFLLRDGEKIPYAEVAANG